MNTRRNKGFTLIELLTVIVIISILIALLFPAIKSALLKAEVNQARSDVFAILAATKAYYTEYGHWPNTSTAKAIYNYGVYGGGSEDSPNSVLMACLRGVSVGGNNQKQIVFFSTPSRKNAFDSTGNFLDPWNNQYEITIDTWNSSTCTNVQSGAYISNAIPQAVCVWSRGPDGVSNATNYSDDVTSWQ